MISQNHACYDVDDVDDDDDDDDHDHHRHRHHHHRNMCDSVKSLFSTPLSLWATLVTPNTYIGGDSTGAQTSVRRTSQVPEIPRSWKSLNSK